VDNLAKVVLLQLSIAINEDDLDYVRELLREHLFQEVLQLLLCRKLLLVKLTVRLLHQVLHVRVLDHQRVVCFEVGDELVKPKHCLVQSQLHVALLLFLKELTQLHNDLLVEVKRPHLDMLELFLEVLEKLVTPLAYLLALVLFVVLCLHNHKKLQKKLRHTFADVYVGRRVKSLNPLD